MTVREKAEARAKAARQGRRAIHNTFDDIERQPLRAYQHLLGQPLRRCCVPPLIELIVLTNLSTDIGALTTHLRGQATSIAQTPPFPFFFDTTFRLLDGEDSGGSKGFCSVKIGSIKTSPLNSATTPQIQRISVENATARTPMHCVMQSGRHSPTPNLPPFAGGCGRRRRQP